MAEDKKPSKPEGRYGKTEKKPDKAPEKKPESKDDAAVDASGDAGMSEHASMVKRQLQEFRDMHGQHRDAMKSMHSRHETEMQDMMTRMAAPQGDGQDGAPDAGAEPAGAQEAA